MHWIWTKLKGTGDYLLDACDATGSHSPDVPELSNHNRNVPRRRRLSLDQKLRFWFEAEIRVVWRTPRADGNNLEVVVPERNELAGPNAVLVEHEDVGNETANRLQEAERHVRVEDEGAGDETILLCVTRGLVHDVSLLVLVRKGDGRSQLTQQIDGENLESGQTLGEADCEAQKDGKDLGHSVGDGVGNGLHKIVKHEPPLLNRLHPKFPITKNKPKLITMTIEAKLSSIRMTSEASFATSLPFSPIETPICALFNCKSINRQHKIEQGRNSMGEKKSSSS